MGTKFSLLMNQRRLTSIEVIAGADVERLKPAKEAKARKEGKRAKTRKKLAKKNVPE